MQRSNLCMVPCYHHFMTMSSLKEYLLFNKNILIGFVGAFLTGAAISQAIAVFTSPLVNSLVSIVAELGVFLAIFGVLFYFDNKDKFIDERGKRRESGKVKWVLLKLASSSPFFCSVLIPSESNSFSHQPYRSGCSISAIDIDRVMTL